MNNIVRLEKKVMTEKNCVPAENNLVGKWAEENTKIGRNNS